MGIPPFGDTTHDGKKNAEEYVYNKDTSSMTNNQKIRSRSTSARTGRKSPSGQDGQTKPDI
jgi:hypothetical protein